MKEIQINTEYITLGQFLKIADIIESGGEAKIFLATHQVFVNEIEDERRGRKLRENDIVRIDNSTYKIVKCA
jgi:S4 domain protein YaaA